MKTPMLSLRRKNLVGLDIDASTVRMVQLRKGGGEYVAKAAVTNIAPWVGDPQLRRIHTVKAILQGLSHAGITTKYAVCGLRGPEVVVRDFEFPAMTPEEIAGAVELEVSQICPFLAEESTFDFQVTANNDKRTTGFWVAATNELIENTRQLVSEAGLHCALVDVAGLALLNLLQNCGGHKPEIDDRDQSPNPGQAVPSDPSRSESPPKSTVPVAVLNLGDSCVTIAIGDPAGRPFVRDIGSGAVLDDRPSLAASRLATHGSFSAEDGWAARGNHRPVTNDSLVEDVTTTLRYYATQNGSAQIDRLLVCGESAAAEESAELLRMRLNLEVEPWNPLTDGRFRMDPCGLENTDDANPPSAILSPRTSIRGQDPQWYGPSLAVAAGLALRSI
jgi:type IV pilus assembly protein PilM